MKVLLVDDDRDFCDYISTVLTEHRYAVDVFHRGKLVLDIVSFGYDVVILDVNLPDINGIELCQRLRHRGISTPILMLTASHDRSVQGLDQGADDYIVKPCKIEELLARMRALLRRKTDTLTTILRWGRLSLNPVEGIVKYDEQVVNLRPKEYQLLELFLRNPQRLLDRDTIISHIWRMDDVPTNHAVTNLIKDLRKRLQGAGMTEDFIQTIYGVGYRLREPPIDSLQSIQENFLKNLDQRLQALQTAIQPIIDNTAQAHHYGEAEKLAHQLAGSLGTFGLPEASTISRSLELLLKQPNNVSVDSLREMIARLKQAISVTPQPMATVHFFNLGLVTRDIKFADQFYLHILSSKLKLIVLEPQEILAQGHKLNLIILRLEEQADHILVRNLRTKHPNVPIFVLDTYPDTIERRVEVSKFQPDLYFSSNIPLTQVVTTVCHALCPAKKRHVLVVDDDPDFLQLVTDLLQQHHFTVTSIEDSSQILATLAKEKFDLLLIDFDMPKFNGLEICRSLKYSHTYSELPIVFVTAHTYLAETLFSAGANDVIPKLNVNYYLLPRIIKLISQNRQYETPP
ncbi:MAG: response regulator [Pseudanabaenaceae cyanobacterium SKYGB_i_bin29]|nr:response regulator [Pseudanabaenaceae cyanobacterium SKYG29]MDW8421107.1 response regulator [Pseudanabaenaceae cyanobacterium SKYGB_i_bin29]